MSVRSIERRCMTKAEAADYCRLTKSGFQARVSRGLLPRPLPGTHRWDQRALDAALDRQSEIKAEKPESAFQRWKRERDARSA